MKTLGLNHYNLRAHRDLLEKLRVFYCDVVGLSVGFRPPFKSYGYWLYAGEQAILHLTESSPGESQDFEATTSFNHVAFSCSGLAEFKKRLAQHSVMYNVEHVPQTAQVQLFFRDPASNGIELNFERENA